MYSFKCVMGCKKEPGLTLHRFPKNAQRRAEWCRILGVYPRTKRVYLCKAHISDCYIFGNRLTNYAIPNPPPSSKLNTNMMAISNELTDYKVNEKLVSSTPPEISGISMPDIYDDNSVTTFPETEISFPQAEIKNNYLAEDPLKDSSNFKPSLKETETEESLEEFGKVEDFEIRNGSNKDMIIKGRFIQTNDYLVVSYTPPRKWSLQEQVKILDETCQQQLKKIRQLNKENYRLYKELKMHERLLPKLRSLQTHNRFLYAQLKMYKIHEKDRRKRIKKKRLKNKNISALEENSIETKFK